MIGESQVRNLIGSTAYDQSGEKIGKVGQVYYDDETNQPTWVTVHTGLFGTNETFVPVQGAELGGDRVTLAYDKATVKDAPNLAEADLKGARVTRLGRRMYMDELIEVEIEGGRVAYDIYNNPPGRHEEEGTDFAAVEAGEISVTPVHLQLTDHAGLKELQSWDVKTLLSENGSR